MPDFGWPFLPPFSWGAAAQPRLSPPAGFFRRVMGINLNREKYAVTRLLLNDLCPAGKPFKWAPERRCSSRTFRYGYLVTT